MGAGLRLPRRQLAQRLPDYQRVERHADGVYRVASERLARRHRMGIGTIVSDASLQLKYWSKGGGGKTLGSVEEAFIARLRPGDAGVCRAGAGTGAGGKHDRLCASQHGAQGCGGALEWRAHAARANWPTRWSSSSMLQPMNALTARKCAQRPLLALQARGRPCPPPAHCWPRPSNPARAGTCSCTLAGRMANLGLANLIAWRVSRVQPLSVSIAVNDYGFELLSPARWTGPHLPQALAPSTCWKMCWPA
jgi:ATP-dependent Lhr-like helicase